MSYRQELEGIEAGVSFTYLGRIEAREVLGELDRLSAESTSLREKIAELTRVEHPKNHNHIKCPICGAPWIEHEAGCSGEQYRPRGVDG